MSQNLFLPTRRPITKTVARKIRGIAARHGAAFVGPVSLPGNNTTGWFTSPNLGSPFDQQVRDAVAADLHAAGIEL